METVFALNADASDNTIHNNSNTNSKNGNTSNSSSCSSNNNYMYSVPDQARPWCLPGSGYSTELLFETKN